MAVSRKVILQRLGARRTPDSIEPSCGVMDVVADGAVAYRLVVDCGLAMTPVPGHPRLLHHPDFSLFDDGKKIDAVLYTHVHADHFGAAVRLVPYMSRNAKIFMTNGSFVMASDVLEDNLIGLDESGTARGLSQIAEVIRRTRVMRAPGEIEILPGIAALVWPAGHIPGACSYTFRVGALKVHYAGDRCSHDQPGIKGAPPLPEEWRPTVIAGSDCTYGADPDSDTRDYRDEMDRGMELCREALRRGSKVVIPAFAVYRGGAIAHALQEGGLHELGRVLLDGKCQLYADIMEKGTGRWSPCDGAIDTSLVERIGRRRKAGERRSGIADDGGFVVVTTAGMGGPGGPVTYWRRQVLRDPDALMLFSGYLAPDTDGAKILAAARVRDETGAEQTVTFDVQQYDGTWIKESFPVRCQVARMRIGGHDNRLLTLDWFETLRPEAAVLAHGSESSLESIAGELSGIIPKIHRSHEGPLVIPA